VPEERGYPNPAVAENQRWWWIAAMPGNFQWLRSEILFIIWLILYQVALSL
jgi:hypothetical protein